MLKSLEQQDKRETGKIVTDPRVMNYTWIHWTYQNVKKIEVQENKIIHLKRMKWLEKFPKSNKYSNFSIIKENTLKNIEHDWKIMRKKVNSVLKKTLPQERFYEQVIGDCYQKKFYSYMYAGAPPVPCSGPHYCEYPQRDDIKCVHVDARYDDVPRMSPISFYFAVYARFNSSIGCYS
ncbi:unnamed protein product [Caenorhabditis angaria]|uniref:Glycosyltransferase family 92 protein n=1 Tax=Caenorhabditis angaria TaxID=860376 RepID=A0A9P1N8K4_9PELO|nr:unnamed protein product [Caenorhabditis angaria]